MTVDALTAFPAQQNVVDSPEPGIGDLERLPKWMNLIPMVAQWLFLSLRYGSVTLPSAANPAITSGGLVGEGKLEYFATMGALGRSATAPFTSLVVGKESDTLAEALTAMADAGLDFPVILKPNIGWCGFGVQRINNKNELHDYLSAFPKNETVVIQRFVPDEGEAGIFYVRHPDEAVGRVIGILLRSFPRVIGDGQNNVGELIKKDPRLKRLGWDGLHNASYDASYIPAKGEMVRLATIGSTRVGGLYRDGTNAATPALTSAIDAIAQDMTAFHVGRFDVRYETIADLQNGRFTIIEVNGAGSEAVHAWDPRFSLREAYQIVFAKQRLLFQIAAAMRKRGHKPIGLYQLAKLYFWQQKLIRDYPPSN